MAQPAAFALKAAALLIGTMLATPYSLDYDLMLLAPAIAFLAADGIERGFAPYEKTVLAALWLVPLIARSVAAGDADPARRAGDAGSLSRFCCAAPWPRTARRNASGVLQSAA